MITTASKLMLANKEVENLKDELYDAKLEIKELEAELSQLSEDYEEQVHEANHYRILFEGLKLDKETPWWRFW